MRRFQQIGVMSREKWPKGIDQSVMNQIHRVLRLVGEGNEKLLPTLREEWARPETPSLESFERFMLDTGWEMTVPNFLKQPPLKAYNQEGQIISIADMTTNQIKDLHDLLQRMEHAGREINKVTLEGKQYDLEEVILQIVDSIQQLPYREGLTRQPAGRLIYRLDAEML